MPDVVSVVQSFRPVARVYQFVQAVGQHWGVLVTSGVLIGAIGIWQGTGHTVRPWVYSSVAIIALFIATFRAWNNQVGMEEQARAENSELRRRIQALESQPEGPEIWLSFEGNQIGNRLLIVKNIAGGTARNIQLEEMSDGKLIAERSDAIPYLSVGDWMPVRPRVRMMAKEWESITSNLDNFFSRAERPIVATVYHEDASGKRFMTVFSITPSAKTLDIDIRQTGRKILSQ